MDEPTLIYLAGFFDADGCIDVGHVKSSDHSREQYRLSVLVTQKDPQILELLVVEFGAQYTILAPGIISGISMVIKRLTF